MTDKAALRISYDRACLESIRELPDRVAAKFMDMLLKFMNAPSANGLNFESVNGARDRGLKSIRIDQNHRAIAFQSGPDVLFLHVDSHDDAYAWARGRVVRLDPATNRIRVFIEAVETEQAAPQTRPRGLFDAIPDARLKGLGVLPEEFPRVRAIRDLEDFEAARGFLDPVTYDLLVALNAGYEDREIRLLLDLPDPERGEVVGFEKLDFSAMVASPESRQSIFIPETEAELRRVFDGDLAGWRVFLHPEQRRIAYRDHAGPVLVRGGAGTGKTVVAMHRAKDLADKIAADPARRGRRVLFTTFTTSLAHDVRENLKTLCPEHLSAPEPRIEVANLDRWVQEFLKRKDFARAIVYFGAEAEKQAEIWREVFDDLGTPEGLTEEFVRAEWSQIVQAKGLLSQQEYFHASRSGRGTPLDRRKRAELWRIFDSYRVRMLAAGLAEPDDAYREAASILSARLSPLPYDAVVVDEAQDMGEQAFRLIRAIVPPGPEGDANSLFIVGDAHQRIYARRASMKACGIEVRGRSRNLRLNYRTSEEIRRWAVSVLEGAVVDDLDEGQDDLTDYRSLFNGPEPVRTGFASEAEEIEALKSWLLGFRYRKEPLADLGVLTATNEQAKRIEAALSAAGLPSLRLMADKPDDRETEGVRLCTMHRAKGLEFRAVWLPFLSAETFPAAFILAQAVDEVDRRDMEARFRALLHVAATRAKSELRLSWSGEPSRLLK